MSYLVKAIRHQHAPAITMVALCLIATYMALAMRDPGLFMTADTEGYIIYFSMRTYLYPYLLQAFRAVFDHYEAIVPAQIILLTVSCGALGYALGQYTNRPWWGAAVTAATLANPYAYQLAYMGLTDAFFMAGLNAYFCLLLLYLKQPRLSLLIYAGIIIGISISLRPVAYAMVPLLLFVFLLKLPRAANGQSRWLAAALCALLPVLILGQVQSMMHRIHHGENRYETLAITLFAKAAMLGKATPDGFIAPAFGAMLQTEMAPRLAALENVSGPTRQFDHMRDLESWAQYQFPENLMKAGMAESGINYRSEFMMAVGLAYLTAYPIDYILNGLHHTFGAWILFDERDPGLFYLAATYTMLLFGFLTALMALGGLLLLVWRGANALNQPWGGVFLSALFLHGYTLLIGFTCIAISRYICAAWGPLVVALGVPLLLLLELALKRWQAKIIA